MKDQLVSQKTACDAVVTMLRHEDRERAYRLARNRDMEIIDNSTCYGAYYFGQREGEKPCQIE